MKKIKIIILILIVFVVTGCSISTLDKDDFEANIDIILSGKNKVYNVYFEGYKYYVPTGVSFIDKEEYNAILKDYHNNNYYLYVDVISYYNKEKETYTESSKAYYSSVLEYDKSGYIQIDEIDNKYLIQYIYNYSKMEAYVSKDDLVETINNMSYILRSIKYNRKVINSLIGSNSLNYKEETYSLFNKKVDQEDFLDVVYENEDESYKKAVDEEKIDIYDE